MKASELMQLLNELHPDTEVQIDASKALQEANVLHKNDHEWRDIAKLDNYETPTDRPSLCLIRLGHITGN
jgi:hypothetical protein